MVFLFAVYVQKLVFQKIPLKISGILVSFKIKDLYYIKRITYSGFRGVGNHCSNVYFDLLTLYLSITVYDGFR
jgi:hypothetical protein